jgi:hypothetical protein
MFLLSQSGNTLTAGTVYNTICGDLALDTSRTRTVDGSGNIEFWTASACTATSPSVQNFNWHYRFTAGPGDWSSNCDRVVLNELGFYEDNSTFGGGTHTLITYPESEQSSQNNPSDYWSEASYVWKGTAVTSASGRHFGGRPFYEDDNTPSADDNCWFAPLSPTYRYDYLNKPNGGPMPNESNWDYLDQNESWDDYVGWGPFSWVTYYRQNSPTIVSNGNNGSCRAIVGQRMFMVEDWGGGLWDSRPYQDNTHTITIWNVNIANYSTTSTTDWTVQSQRSSNVAAKYKVWPILQPPTSVAVTDVSSSAVNLGWGGAGGDFNEYNLWRIPAGGSAAQLGFTRNTLYQDSTVAANSEYYYCVAASRMDIDPIWSTQMHTIGPCSDEVHALTYPQPTSLSVNPGTVRRSLSECYTMTAGNGSNMTLDVQYTLNGVPQQPIIGWPSLNANGQSNPICTSPITPLGTYAFTDIRNTLNSGMPWVQVNAQITVID